MIIVITHTAFVSYIVWDKNLFLLTNNLNYVLMKVMIPEKHNYWSFSVLPIGSHNGSSVKHAWKINNADKDDKLYILFAKSSQSKQEWMEAFSREREIVERNAERGMPMLVCN